MVGRSLSAILPNYNHAHLIGEAVAALLHQSRKPDEVIVVDDGSTDESVATVEALAQDVPTLRLIKHGENRGAIEALRTGILAAAGEYIYLGAADDITAPTLFEEALRALEAHPDLALYCSECILVDQDGNFLGVRPAVRPSYSPSAFRPPDVARLLRRMDNWILAGTAVIRRDLVLAAGNLDPALRAAADGFLLRTLTLKHGFFFDPRPLQTWRINPQGLSRKTARDYRGALELLDIIKERITYETAYPDWYAGLFDRRWRFNIGRLALTAVPLDTEAIIGVAGSNSIDRWVYRCTGKLPGRLARIIAQGWLFLRTRPYRLTDLVRTWLSRRGKSVYRPTKT